VGAAAMDLTRYRGVVHPRSLPVNRRATGPTILRAAVSGVRALAEW